MYDVPTWTEENRSLHNAICQARVSVEAVSELQLQLQINKEKFIQLLDNEAKNQAHRSTLNNSECIFRVLFLTEI